MTPSKEWLDTFDYEMKSIYAVSLEELGWDETFLGRWCDIPPREAAERLGEKYDLIADFADNQPRYFARTEREEILFRTLEKHLIGEQLRKLAQNGDTDTFIKLAQNALNRSK